MEVYYKPDGGNVEQAVEAAIEEAMAGLTVRLDNGAALLPAVEKTYELIPSRLKKAITRFHKRPPLPSDWGDFRPELTFPDHGNCRVDLLHSSDLGPCITDFKSKVTATDYAIDGFLFDAETSWQMYHYVWAAREMGLDVRSFAICLIVIEPFSVHLNHSLVDEEYLARWQQDAHYWWSQMERLEHMVAMTNDGIVPRVGDHRDKYGLCSMYTLCTQPGGEVHYNQRERTA